MAPEILKGDIYNYKCDLYSIGVCLYKIIFKEFPFKGKVESSILKNMIPFKGKVELSILENMILFGTKNLKKTGIKSLDDLLEGLLAISPDK